MVDWLAVEPMGASTLFSSFCVLRLVPPPPPVLTPFVFLRFAKVCKVAADRFGLGRVSAYTNLCACVIAAYADDRCKFDGRWCSLVMEDCIFFWLLACAQAHLCYGSWPRMYSV